MFVGGLPTGGSVVQDNAAMSGNSRGEKAPGRRLTSSYPSMAARLRCARCAGEHPAYGIIIRVTRPLRREPFCFECYEQETGGTWHDTDEYWDGFSWIPLARGK